ncbi:MAG: peptidylprolyl isomerase [Acidobacteriota bacterium]
MTLRPLLLCGLLAAGFACATAGPSPESANAAAKEDLPRVLFETELGPIVLQVDTRRAPITGGNFLRYVDEARYRDAHFYRVVTPSNQPGNPVRIAVIQGGLGFDPHPSELPPIAHETTADTGILHRDGTLSLARAEPGTGSSEIFICIGDQPGLDYGGQRNPDGQGFAAFGQVVEGMEVVRAIHRLPEDKQFLLEPVAVTHVQRVGAGRASED